MDIRSKSIVQRPSQYIEDFNSTIEVLPTFEDKIVKFLTPQKKSQQKFNFHILLNSHATSFEERVYKVTSRKRTNKVSKTTKASNKKMI